MRLFRVVSWSAVLTLAVAAGNAQTSNPLVSLKPDAMPACSKSLLYDFEVTRDGEPAGSIPIWQVGENSAFYYEAGMTIDADGAPNAYNPDDTGIDDLENAGADGTWWALALDHDGEPYIQGPDDPFPGYYISTTALWDPSKDPTDPSRFVDASKIPYIVLPSSVSRDTGARLGDLAIVINRRNNKMSYAIFADIGPAVGEGSIALADNLGIASSARHGGAHGEILYIIFPGSGNGRARPLDEINQEADKLFHNATADQIRACTAN